MDWLRKSGEGRESDAEEVPADFPFFDDIDAVMGGRDSVSPVHLLDSAFTDTQDDGSPENIEVPDTPRSASTSNSSPDTPGLVSNFAGTPSRS